VRGGGHEALVESEQVGDGAEDDATAAQTVDSDYGVARSRLHQNFRAARLDALVAEDLAREVCRRLARREALRVVGFGVRAEQTHADEVRRETFQLRRVEDDCAAL